MNKKLFISALCAMNAALCFSQTPVYLDRNAKIEDRVEDALSRMTLEEKVALSHAQSKFSTAGVARLGIPELWMSDGPHGVRAEINWNDWGYANHTNDSVRHSRHSPRWLRHGTLRCLPSMEKLSARRLSIVRRMCFLDRV